ncbi:hypothetical protein KIW84_040316 [Lathyrus oleraceus]|uniref:Uncharacterized protein n=1 Tax=Pisum sativum TaxID=3888 RepID=A0A9D5AMU6_PEA|nr:hypothetical protein KIW84_040316 [Pisum sativum]
MLRVSPIFPSINISLYCRVISSNFCYVKLFISPFFSILFIFDYSYLRRSSLLSIQVASPSEEFQWFTSETHAQRYRDIYTCNIIEEKAWVLKHGELPEVNDVLKKQKLTHLNAQIQPVARDLVLELYANTYRAPDDEATDATQLVSQVRGKKIDYSRQNINRMLKCKFRESNCSFHTMKRSDRSDRLFEEMRQLLARPGRIIAGDVNEIVQSHKKALGHAIVIGLLCQKVGVEDLDDRKMLRPPCCLDPSWLKEKTIVVMSKEQRPPRHTYASEVGTSEPPSQATSHGDMCAHIGAPGRYLTHQSDTWASAQRFRDRFSGEPSAPHYSHYRYPGMETPIQLGGPIS